MTSQQHTSAPTGRQTPEVPATPSDEAVRPVGQADRAHVEQVESSLGQQLHQVGGVRVGGDQVEEESPAGVAEEQWLTSPTAASIDPLRWEGSPPPSAGTGDAASEGGAGGLAPVSRLRSRIESVLLVTDSPVSVSALARATGAPDQTVLGVLRAIAREFDDRGSGFDLRESAEGWRLYTRQDNADVVESLLLGGAQSKLTRAALETLAVVAYRQPVTRAQVSAIRGVNVDGVMRTLMLRGLVREVETDASTGAHLYATTELFLELMGIPDLSVLPNLAPLLPDVDAIDEVM